MPATPACRHEPETGPCPACGAVAVAATLACISCRHRLPPDSRFCSACGTPVTLPEHKPVTVLFVSADGTAALGTSLGTEDWHAMVDGFLRILEDGVRLHGGVIDRFTGHGIKALFGVPVAREDHAIAACRAALDLGREIALFAEDIRCNQGIRFAVRMGLHSGDVLYGPIESTVSAQGRTAAIAARIEQSTTPGTIRVSETTARLVERHFELRDLGSLALRGVKKPMQTFELVGTRARRPASAVRAVEPPFVGRQVELALLEAMIHRAGPAVVSLTGEPGIGKTRLLDELSRRADAAGVRTLIRLSALESERDSPFAFYRRALRRLLDVRGGETIESVRDRVAGRLLLADPTLREQIPRILDLVGLGPQGSGGRILLDGLHGQLAALSARLATLVIPTGQRRVVIFDDCQWIDEPSLAVLRTGIDTSIIRPDLLVAAQRSGAEPVLSGTSPYAGSVHLNPHLEAEVDELLDHLLSPDPSLEGLRRMLRERCGGNPLFLGEMVRSLRETGDLAGEAGRTRLARLRGVDELPPTLGALLAARIDGLQAGDRQTLRFAAAIGGPFDTKLLARASGRSPISVGESLARLRVAEIVVPAAGAEQEGFAFRHQLLADAALSTLLAGPRARLHASVADALEAEPDADALASRIASHREQAGEGEAAARWHLRAGIFAASREPRRTLEHLQEADRLLGEVPGASADRLRLDLRVASLDLGWRHGLGPEEAMRLHGEGRRLAERLRDPEAGSVLAAGYAAILGMSGGAADVAPLVRDSRDLAGAVADRGLDIALRTTRALALYAAGDLTGVLHECAEPLSAGDRELPARSFSGSKVVEYLTLRGTALVDTGRFEEGRCALDEAIAEARRSGSAISTCSAVAAASLRARFTGAQPEALLPVCLEGLEMAERSKSDFIRSRILGSLGELNLLLGRNDKAIALFREALEIVESDRTRIRDDFGLLARLAGCLLLARDLRGALETADRSLEAIEGQGGRLREIDILLRWAWIHAGAGRTDPGLVEPRVHRALALVAETGSWSREPFLRLVLAWVHRRSGRAAEAAAETTRALHDLVSMGFWDVGRMQMLERMRDHLSPTQQRSLREHLSEFGVSSRTGPALLP